MAPPSVLVVGDTQFPFHDVEALRSDVESAFGDAAALTVSADRDSLLDLPSYDAVVDYLTDGTLTDAQRDALTGFVADGGGYLGVHCAADLTSVADGDGGVDTRDEPFPELRDLVGGHFVGHPDRTTFGVRITDDHPVTAGVDDFDVFDEPYRVEVDDDVRVLATMDHPDLDEYPVVWVRPYGDGRVCYCSLGHTEAAFAHEGTRRLLRNAVGWVTEPEA